jgi:chromosome partitioning protein
MKQTLSEQLRKWIQPETTFAKGTRSARVISVSAQKGGVGKTTSSVNLGLALAQFHGERVLIVDLDAQGHVGSSLGLGPSAEATPLSHVLSAPRQVDLLEAVCESGFQGLHLTAPDPLLAEVEPILSGKMGREFILRKALQTAKTHYDTIILDCPPNLGNLTINALMASDEVLIPCDMSILAVEGVVSLLSTVEALATTFGHDLAILGVLRTRVDRRNASLNRTVEAALKEKLSHLVMETFIPVNSSVAKAQATGDSLFEVAPASKGAIHYRLLSDEVRGRLELRENQGTPFGAFNISSI